MSDQAALVALVVGWGLLAGGLVWGVVLWRGR